MPFKDPEARRARDRELYQANLESNREKGRARQKAWRDANPERAAAISKAYRDANLDKERVRRKVHREANKDRTRELIAAFHSRNQGTRTGTWTEAEVKILMREDLTLVQICAILDRSYANCQKKREKVRLKNLTLSV